ncbi:DNA-binding protein [Segatella copri]|uniref:DNA-binding protein n=1 Tax=Segatella copri TaxID=165179 RepID=A0A6G1VS38_9BACT|nr:DNA-binding protein [Segatella copri]MQN59406.1 DNA-binding protein [Segatella copri]MQP15543.1 DNA-binding protein [Segatella copri]
MIRIVLYQNTNQKIAEAYGKWFPRVVSDETIGLEELAAHMASHNTPYSKGAILGMLTDAAACTKELLLLGKNVKFADIAIFSLGLKVKGGAPTKEDFNVGKYISGLKLRARATGELKTENLDTSIKLINLAAPATENPGNPDDTGKDNPSGGGSQTTGGGGSNDNTQQGGGGTTDSGSTDEGGGDNVDF